MKEAGFDCLVVGGAVRNLVLGISPGDWDLATDALPADVVKLFRRVIPTGISHGTVTILYKGLSCEMTTFRIDGEYTDLRRPDTVEYTSSVFEDLKRRDFTINAMAMEIATGKIIDPHNGRGDCKKKIIRTVGVPEERFNEDGLRILRALRFAGRLGFTIEPATLAAMEAHADNLAGVSAERIRMELEGILAAERPSEAFNIMAQTGILRRVLPELEACRGIMQGDLHRFDVFTHSILACDGVTAKSGITPDLGLRLAALLHDIGKPPCLTTDNGVPHFYGHDGQSASLTEAIMLRLKFPSALIKRVTHLIREHMFSYTSDWTDAAVRRFIVRVGKENLDDIFALRKADSYGMTGVMPGPKSLEELRGRIAKVLAEEEALGLKDLALNGDDLIKTLGISPGPQIGIILDFLLEAVLEDPAMNTREKLLGIAENFYTRRLKI